MFVYVLSRNQSTILSWEPCGAALLHAHISEYESTPGAHVLYVQSEALTLTFLDKNCI